jgi:hypothetical protein
MFNVTGPAPVTPIQRTEDTALVLRLNQRIVAEVLQVSGENVTLAMDGIRFVAKLSTPDQVAALQERRYAQFVVRDANPSQIVIQLAPQLNPGRVVTSASQDLAQTLLTQMGLPPNESNALILRSLVARGLPVDLSTFSEIQATLDAFGPWGAPEAQAAAALKAAGLPLSPATLALVLNAPQETAQAYSRLISLLKGLSARQVSPQALEALQQAISTLRQASPEWTGNSSAMAQSLRQSLTLLGRSVESELADNLLKANTHLSQSDPSHSLIDLLALRRELAQNGPREVVAAIDRFMESLRYQQFQSSPPEPGPGRSEWINLRLPLHTSLPVPNPSAPFPPNYYEASLRIACQRDGDTRRAEPGFTRFLISVDLDKTATIEVDLSVVERKIGMQVISTTPDLSNLAKEELSAFVQGLNELGFDLQTSRFEVGAPHVGLDRSGPEISPEKFMAIDLEV